MKFDIATGILAVCSLAACAQFGKQTPLEKPTAYSLSEGKSALTSQKFWWLQLDDKKLMLLIDQAIANSPDLRIAKSRFEQAQAQLGVINAETKTQISLSAGGIGAHVAPKPTSSQSETDHTLLLANTALQWRWTFDFWGKNRSQIASVLGKQQAILYEAEQTRNMLAHAVAVQYFTWQSFIRRQKLLSARIDVADRTFLLKKKLVRAGLLPAASLYQINLLQQQLELERLSLELQTTKIRHSLSVLTGYSPYELPIDYPAEMTSVPDIHIKKIYADLLGRRPDITAQKALLESKYHLIKSAEAEFYPNIELKILAGMTHIDAFNVIHGRNSAMFGIMPALHLPIFTSGTLRSGLAGRRAEYNEQVALYDQTVLNAMRSAADAVANYQSLKSKQSVWDSMLAIARKSEKVAQSRKKAGLENGLGSLEKQDEYLQLQIQAVQYQAEYLSAWSNMNAQLGGGSFK